MPGSDLLNVGSLFTGGGGLDMAVKMLWPEARIAWVSEFDKAASSLLAARYLTAPNLGDITAIDWTQVEPVDVLIGGFPCQDISHAGKRAGITKETRSGLWFHFADAIRVLRPRLVLAENVAAITALAGAHDAVLGELADCGFDAEWGVLRASDVGAPHQRARWFLAAWPADSDLAGLEGRDAGGVQERGDERSAGAGDPHAPLLLSPTSNLGINGGTQHPDKRRAGGHGPTLADQIEHMDAWGDYAPAIARWEAILGRPAPDPTDAKGRLSPAFVLWMMGWPEGWFEGVELSRANKLKILGNGVVPQQAAAAYGQLLARATAQEVTA